MIADSFSAFSIVCTQLRPSGMLWPSLERKIWIVPPVFARRASFSRRRVVSSAEEWLKNKLGFIV